MGDIVIGNVGAESRMSFRMVGQPMNTASRLVDLAGDGQIVISTAVQKDLLVRNPELLTTFGFQQMESIQLQGISEPQVLYRAYVTRPSLVK